MVVLKARWYWKRNFTTCQGPGVMDLWWQMWYGERNGGYMRTSKWTLFVFPDLTVMAFSSLLLDVRPDSNGRGNGRRQKNGWAWTQLAVFWFLCLKSEDQEYSWIFWEECKRTKSAKSLQWKRLQEQRRMVRAVDSNQGGCVLVPPHPQPSFTGDQSQSTGKHRNQLWMSQSLQRTTGNSRTSSPPLHTATRSSKPYFKKYIFI